MWIIELLERSMITFGILIDNHVMFYYRLHCAIFHVDHFFKITALMRYSSHTIQLIPTNSVMLSIFLELYKHHYHQFLNIFIALKRNAIPIRSHSLYHWL